MAKLYNKSTKQIQLDPIIKETSNRLMQKIIEKDYLLHKKITQKEYSHLWEAIVQKIYGGNLLEAKANVV